MCPLAKMLLIILTLIGSGLATSNTYYGTEIGKFATHFHDVAGDVYAVNEKTLFIKNFNYDGKGADAVFWVGLTSTPDNTGFVIHPNRDSNEILKPHLNQDVILHLPEGIKITDLRWLSVWSRKFSISFGTVIFPPLLIIPQPAIIGSLNSTRQGVSSGTILVLDSQTFLISDFSYDGSGTDVHWWVSKSATPDSDALQLQDEDGNNASLQERKNKTVIITLPDRHSVMDYAFLILWNNDEKENYGFVEIPRDLNVPPSLRTLEVETEAETNKINCEMLNDNLGLEIRWLISGNDIIIHLVGNLEEREYIMFGLSKDDTETRFDSADAAVAWIDKDGKGHVVDYYLENTETCVDGHGMCPDDVHEGFSNNLLFLNATQFNKTSMITFKRPLKAEDKIYDQNIYTDGPQAVLWAVGPIEEGNLPGTPKLHTRGNLLLDFGRDPNWNCPLLNDEGPTKVAVEQHQFEIHCPSDHTFRAQMGPHTSKNFTYIWYINGLPTPELTVQRGQEYTFIVEGGMGPSIRNPLYITNSSEGGIYQNLLEGTDSYENAFAGVHHDVINGLYFPTSEGRLCLWSVSDQDPEHSVTTSFADSISALMLSCEPGNYAKLVWTPDADTPNTVYYQSFTEKHLGGKIRVLNFCEETTLDSYLKEVKNTSSNLNERSRIKGNQLKPELEREWNFERTKHSSDLENSSELIEKESEPDLEEKEVDEQYRNIINKIPDSDESLLGIKNQRSATIIGDQANDDNRNIFDTVQINNNSSEETETLDSSRTKEPLQLEISQPLSSDSLHPHDESERSDKNIHHHQNTEAKTTVRHNKIPVGDYSSQEKPVMKQQTPSVNVHQKEVIQTPRQPARFKPQFQGGFVPLVLNPIKEKESSLSQEFDHPPSHFRRPHRPFLFNESIPFHGTFKPGVPDFSGFNISHYSQDESYPLNHVLDHLPVLSASNPQMIHRPLTSMNGLPPELFQRQVGLQQRPQIFGYMPRPKTPGLGFMQQPAVLAEHVRHPNSPEEELTEISSQRVQVALQASLEDKGKNNEMPRMQIVRTSDQKLKNKLQTNNMIHTPPIQRRPDFVGEEGPLNPSLFKPNPFPERLNIKNNENLENQRGSAVMKLNGHRNPFNIRRPGPIIKPSFNGMERDKAPTRVPFRGFQIKPNPFLQNPQREIAPHFSGSQRNSPFRQRIPHRVERPRDSMPLMNSNNKFPLLPQMVNPIVNSAENNIRIKIPDDGSASKEQEILPPFLNTEVTQHSAKNSRPQLLTSHTNTRNIPALIMSPNRLQMPQRPTFHLQEEIVKKLPIPMDGFKQQAIAPHPIAPNHLPSEKQQMTLEQKPSNMKANLTVHHNSDSFVSNSNEDQKSEIQPFELSSSIVEVQSDDTKDESIRKEENKQNGDNSSEEGYVNPSSDYVDYDVPFGARLKSTPNKPKLSSQMMNRPFHRKQQSTSPSFIEKTTENPVTFSELEVKQLEELTVPPESSIDNAEKETNKEASVLTFLESFPRKEIVLSTEDDFKANNSGSEKKIEPLFLDDDAIEKHKGRKNILPNLSETNTKLPDIPPRVPENINLPHISEKKPSHDNGTDYSILNHVLSLISGPS
ncbi:uncharacterized protein LOC129960762 [Argiope bruennichi]|uniref:uncharacterized protein LOC129960762 n=1 Tax=Argiope bruennichi TaxID=94029 RepID=UPI002493D0F1|nr:uncharacterized protein LOC129960762 [Argiope bruennichi]